ncbi:unnamed protein product [Orchesella dallaii]|uniref:Odorant receptor n=1 Tax=Orchesella dallaii TaxID=48710 RepID=A0ABP1S7P9_9HEXA
MISDKMLKLIGFRVKVIPFGGGTWFYWNSSTKRFVPPSPYHMFTMQYGMLAGLYFGIIHFIQLYLLLSAKPGIPEEDGEDPDLEFDLHKFATVMVAWGEVFTLLAIVFANIAVLLHIDDCRYLLNQLIAYTETLREMFRTKQIELDEEHKKWIRDGERLILVCVVSSFVVPFLLAPCFLHPIEPTHRLITDWLEFEFGFNLSGIPVAIVFLVGVYSCSNVFSLLAFIAVMYLYTSKPCLNDITTVEVERRTAAGKRCHLVTRFYGVLEDKEVAKFYRIQVYFNNLVNNVFDSVLLSYHHVACIMCASVMACFAIRYQQIIVDGGILAVLVVAVGVLIPLGVVYFEGIFCGDLVAVSEDFKESGKLLMDRKTMHAKFALSCRPLYLKMTHPFYNVDRNTFLEFTDAVVDKTITLLLW